MKLNDIKDLKLTDILDPYKVFTSREDNVRSRRRAIKSFKAREDAKRKPPEKFADWLTSKLGSVVFLTLNVLWFAVWLVINTGLTGIEPFDPFPFGLLTSIVSLEAIILAIIVLVSQNREAKVAEIREEIELQINTLAEGEITKIISLLALLLEKNGIKIDDPELKKMLVPTDTAKIQKDLEEELSKGS